MMATIAVQHSSGAISSVRLRSEGDLCWAGLILLFSYSTYAEACSLIVMGDLKSMDSTARVPYAHQHRTQHYADIMDFLMDGASQTEHGYLFQNGEWVYIKEQSMSNLYSACDKHGLFQA